MIIRSILFCLLLLNLTSALRWIKGGGAPFDPTIVSMKSARGIPEIDVSVGKQIVVLKDIQQDNKMRIYCFVAGYSAGTVISFQFCKDTVCSVTASSENPFQPQTVYDMFVSVESKFEKKQGILIQLELPKSDLDMSGNYYCKATEGSFTIRSNNIQIRDRIFWEQNLILNAGNQRTEYKQIIMRNNTPVTLPCLEQGLNLNSKKPLWTNQEFVSPVLWSVCTVLPGFEHLTAEKKTTFTKCKEYTVSKWEGGDNTLEPKDISTFNKWNTYINRKGELMMFTIEENKELAGTTYAFMCYYKKNPAQTSAVAMAINTYFNVSELDVIKKGVLLEFSPTTYRRPLVAISPLVQSMNIYSRQKPQDHDGRTLPVVSLYAMYYSSDKPEFKWKHNGIDLNNGESITIDRYRVNFMSAITPTLAGTYELTVSDGTDKLVFTINVQVLGPPVLPNSNCMPWVRHVWEYSDTEISCLYNERPKELKVSINDQEITFNQPLIALRASLQTSYPYLSLLNATSSLNFSGTRDQATVTYKVFNISKTQGQTKEQDHTVTFAVSNDFGLSIKSASIYAVPRLKPLILISPESMNCTAACHSGVGHNFKCRINTEGYLNKELIVDHYWSINSHRLEQQNKPDNKFAPYFVVDQNNKDLYMKPIVSNDTERDAFVKAALADNNIVCHLNLVAVPGATSRFVYNSFTDPSLGSMLKAKITLDYQPINTAYIYWIVAVILALLIIIIMIVLLTRYCMRNKGETYKLDKIERQHGYDPEKEVQEEMFKPYEREEHDPDALSASTGDRKLSITGHSVGSADDGELDNYDLDPSNFNEDGSIIGKYGANPRNRAAMP